MRADPACFADDSHGLLDGGGQAEVVQDLGVELPGELVHLNGKRFDLLPCFADRGVEIHRRIGNQRRQSPNAHRQNGQMLTEDVVELTRQLAIALLL
ncbi:MAG: hypothetical protein R2724_09095 [Bryobacterales bacterium]